jgi:hypothetical protein
MLNYHYIAIIDVNFDMASVVKKIAEMGFRITKQRPYTRTVSVATKKKIEELKKVPGVKFAEERSTFHRA